MVNAPQPYVTTGNNYNSNQQPPNTSNPHQPANTYATRGGGVYGASPGYAPAPAGGYGGTTNYSSTPTPGYAPAPVGGYGGAMNYSTPTTASSGYAPAPVGGYHATTATYSSGPTTTSTTPDFSRALDLPPPAFSANPGQAVYGSTPSYDRNSTCPSGYATSTGPQTYGPAVVIPANNTGGYQQGGYPSGVGGGKPDGGYSSVAMTSSIYSGGPTGGLISEGNPTVCHKVDYEIKGHEMQLVEIELDPSESVIAEAGALMFMEEGIDFQTKFGDGSSPKEGFFKKLANAGGRLLTGESLFVTHFSNKGNTKARVAFAAPFPGTLLPLNLQNLGGKIICEKDAFLCAALGTKLSIHLNKKLGSGLAGGEGFILQKLEGDGMVFIHAGGTVIKRELRGETLRIDTGCVVAFTDGINFDIQCVPGLKSMIFGGEGMFLATLQGNGTVWIQSLPFSKLAARIIQAAPFGGGR